MIEAIQQNFLHPIGLTALLSLIPLIVFYLVKPQPEEEVMPSMTFFSEEKKEGKIRNAFQQLKRNKLLILHILFVIIAATAIANPLVRGLESEDESVIVLDSSASVQDNRQGIEEFALSHLGETNTIITTSSQPSIELRQASTEKARDFIKSYNIKAEGTDIVSAVHLASNYPGKIVIASDMAQTSTSQDLNSVLSEMASERTVKAMDINQENSHGFTGLEVKDDVVEVTVRNFVDRNRSVEITGAGKEKEINIGGLSSRQVVFNLEPGLHELMLPPDEFALDNELHVSVPKQQEVEVSYVGEESRYFREAINIVNTTEYVTGLEAEADIYFVSENVDLDQHTEAIEQKMSSESALIFESQRGVEKFAPVVNRSNEYEKTVSLSSGLATSFRSNVTRYNATGASLASPEEAFVLSEGEGVLLYNVDDEKFGEKITYPVFWKNILHRMADLKSAEELNIRTGQQKQFESPVKYRGNSLNGYTDVDNVGFYRGNPSYAANLLNPDESAPSLNRINSQTSIGEKPGRDPAQKYLSVLLAIMAMLELTYLARRGEI